MNCEQLKQDLMTGNVVGYNKSGDQWEVLKPLQRGGMCFNSQEALIPVYSEEGKQILESKKHAHRKK